MDIAHSEKVDLELNILIERCHDRKRTEEGERPTEEAWAESYREYGEMRRTELVFEWCEFYERQAQRAIAIGERIAAENRARAAKLMAANGKGAA